MARVASALYSTAIDVGTTKICVLIARMIGTEAVEVIGVGTSPSDGLSKGVVVDVARTVASIQHALKEAQIMAGHTVESCHVGISGAHIRSYNSLGVVPIKKDSVSADDIAHALTSARAIPIEQGEQILHVLPQYFVIDGGDMIHDPRGMYGTRLEVQAHIITGQLASVKNLIKCCELAGVRVTDVVLEQIASAHAVLSHDEQSLGVGVVDIGGGTSDFACYYKGTIRYTRVLPVAGNHFTQDIAIGLRTGLSEAERIKCMYGSVVDAVDVSQQVEIRMVDGQQMHSVPRALIQEIVQARFDELLALVDYEINSQKLAQYCPAGIVLTGGGSLLGGSAEYAQRMLALPVRLGAPRVSSGIVQMVNSPIYATSYGLLLYALEQAKKKNEHAEPLMQRVYNRMKSWVADFF